MSPRHGCGLPRRAVPGTAPVRLSTVVDRLRTACQGVGQPAGDLADDGRCRRDGVRYVAPLFEVGASLGAWSFPPAVHYVPPGGGAGVALNGFLPQVQASGDSAGAVSLSEQCVHLGADEHVERIFLMAPAVETAGLPCPSRGHWLSGGQAATAPTPPRPAVKRAWRGSTAVSAWTEPWPSPKLCAGCRRRWTPLSKFTIASKVLHRISHASQTEPPYGVNDNCGIFRSY